MRTAVDLIVHAAIPLAEEMAHGADATAVVATQLTTTLVAVLLVGCRLKSRRQAWILLALFAAGVLVVAAFIAALGAVKFLGLG